MLCYLLVPMIVRESSRMAGLIKAYAATDLKIPFVPEELHEFLRKT